MGIYDDYVKFMKGGGAAKTPAPSLTFKGSAGGGGESEAAAPSQSPLQWGIDMISRPMYAVTGAINKRLENASRSAVVDAVKAVRGDYSGYAKHALGAASPLLSDNEGVFEAAWKGLTSTDPADKKHGTDIIDTVARGIAGPQGKTYEAPTLANIETNKGLGAVFGDTAAAVGRGVGGFATDVALDPLTYGTLGIVPAIKFGAKALRGVTQAAKGAKGVTEAVETAAKPAPRAPEKVAVVSSEAPAAPAVAPARVAPEIAAAPEAMTAAAAPMSRAGAANVAATSARGIIDTSASSAPFARVSNPAAKQLPKVSETLSTHSGGIVEALIKASRELDDAATKGLAAAPAPKPVPKSAKGTKGTLGMVEPVRVALEGVKKPLMQNVKLPGATRPVDLYPTTLVNELGKRNLQGQRELINYIVRQAKERGAVTPELQRTVAAAKSALSDTPVAPQAVNNAVETATEALTGVERSDLLPSLLKTTQGKPTQLGKELLAAVGPKVFGQLSSKRAGAGVSAARHQIFEELTQLAKNADEVSPATFDGMHESVRQFTEDTLKLRREDFDLLAREKARDTVVGENLFNRSTARSIDPETMKGAEAMTGLTARELTNRFDTEGARIVGSYFDPSKGRWEGGTYHFKDPLSGNKYAIVDGDINQYAFTRWGIGIRDSIKSKLSPVTSGFYKGKVPPQAVTRALREGIPATPTSARVPSMPEAYRAVEQQLFDSGVMLGPRVGAEKVPLIPSHVFDAATTITSDLRAAGNGAAASMFEKHMDAAFFNPGTATPESLFFEAMGAHMLGKSQAEVLEILGRTKSLYNGAEIKRQPLGVGRAGGQMNRTKYSAEELRNINYGIIEKVAPFMRTGSVEAYTQYVQKSLTDASAIATRVESDFAAALGKSEGDAVRYLAEMKSAIVQMGREYGASGHALGMASESLSKQLPPWAVKRAESVKRTETAMRNAVTAGKTPAEIRALGAVSEARHTPVELTAAVDDAEMFMQQADELAEAGDEAFYGLGTHASEVLKEEVTAAGAWRQMTHLLQTNHNPNYGGVVDGIKMSPAQRYAIGSTGKDVMYRSRDINAWGKRHQTVPIAGTNETVASAAFKLLQQGADTVPPEILSLPHGQHLAQALEELKPLAGHYFDVTRAGFAGDIYWRSGAQNIQYLERGLEAAGLSKKYGNVLEGVDSITDWWRKVDVDDPVEFLQRYNSAVYSAMGERLGNITLIRQLKQAGLMSDVAKPGFAKPHLQGKSFFYAGLHDAGMYVDKRVLDAMSEIDRKIHAARSWGEGNIISTGFDPVLNAWKTAMTIMRPGHHIRNTLSNGMLAFVDQGIRNLSKSGVAAARLLARREGNRGLEGMSEVERLLRGETSGIKGDLGNEVVSTVTLGNGKKLDLTYDLFNDKFGERGMFRTFQQSEDIVEGSGRVQRVADAATMKNTAVGKGAAAISEATDHHSNIQHAMQIVLNNASQVGRQFKTLDDLFDYAVERSYKFHPDSMVLTPLESKYMRRLIPFYTWFKGTLPAVIESSVLHPGRVAVAHKGSFNIAQMFGIDAESYANPWPEDADVPDYMKEGVFGANAMFGDQMFSMNPGFAHQDLARMFFGRGPEEGGNVGSATLGNAARSLYGMLNPAITVPTNLLAGQKLDTGAKVFDGADLIDESLPLVNYLTSSSGIQFTGNLLDPFGAIAQGRPHESSKVDRGYQASIIDEGFGDVQGLKGINWLLGQSAQRVKTFDQAAGDDAMRDERLAAREEGRAIDPSVRKKAEEASALIPLEDKKPKPKSKDDKGGSSSSGSKSDKKVSAEELLGALSIPKQRAFDAPAELDLAAIDEYVAQLEDGTGKKMTPSQRLTVAKQLQEDALRRQSAMNWSEYASGSLQDLAAENPELTLSELLAMLKYTTPNPYKK